MRSRHTGSYSGWLVFAAVMIFLAGFHNLIYGVADLHNYGYVVTNAGTVVYQDLDFWGWLLIALGCAQIIAAVGLMSRNEYARWFAIAVAGLNIIAQLAFLAVFPVWSVVLIALDILVIWALATHYYAPTGPRTAAGEPYPEDDAAYAERQRMRGRPDYAASAARRTGEGARHGTAGRGGEARGPETGGPGGTGGTGGTGGETYGSEGRGDIRGTESRGTDLGGSPPRGSEMPPPPPTTGPTG
jgi:hypothetical protein